MPHPLYTISEVEALTGFSPEVLRQWERRYGFPRPRRTPGGHRLYTAEEVEALRRIKAWLAAGLSPRAAILRLKAENPLDPTPLKEALLAGELERAEGLFRKALRVLGPEEAILSLAIPILEEVGRLWHEGRLSAAEEHLVTVFLRARVQELLDFLGHPAGPLVLVTTPPGERHEIGAMLVAFFLRRLGVRAVYLGPDTPLEDLKAYAGRLGARAVVLSAPLSGPLRQLPNGALRGLSPLVFLGGQGASPEEAARLGARYARTAEEIAEEVRDEKTA